MTSSERRASGAPSEPPAKATESSLEKTTDTGLHVPDVSGLETLEAALAYAEAGWYVLPVLGGSKHPGSVVGDAWPSKSSRDRRVIEDWFAQHDYGIALHCGRSGAVVFDVDDASALPELLTEAIRTYEPPFQETRVDDPSRGHHIFKQPAGRTFGNGGGALGKAWGEVRGHNGVIIVQPSPHRDSRDGGRYEWATVGPVPEWPGDLSDALAGAAATIKPATHLEVERFLEAHTVASRPQLLRKWIRLFRAEVAAGASRHQSMLSKLAGALEESAAGLMSAQAVANGLRASFIDAVTQPPTSERQRAARTMDEARAEWEGILAWAVAKASAAGVQQTLDRVATKVPAPGPAQQTGSSKANPIPLEEAHRIFRRWLGANYDLDVLDAVLAAAAVEKLDGDPAWLLIVAGSGAAKTETVAPLGASGAYVTSTISSEGALLSGTSRKERASTATGGLLRKVGSSGVLVIKDVTSILSMNRDARGAVLAALREVYDGRWERNLGNDGGQSLEWVGRLVVIGAVTTAWDRAHQVISSMGDRFVLIRLDSTQGRAASGRQAIANTGDEEGMRSELGEAVAGVLAGVEPTAGLAPTDEEASVILALADIVTRARTAVEHDYRGDVIDAHAPEMPTRFAKQLTQILRGCMALGMDRAHALRIVTRCAGDSLPPLRLAVLLDLLAHPASSTTDVRKSIDKPRATVDRTLQALHMLGLVTVTEEDIEGGKALWRYSLSRELDVSALRRLRRSQKCRERDASRS